LTISVDHSHLLWGGNMGWKSDFGEGWWRGSTDGVNPPALRSTLLWLIGRFCSITGTLACWNQRYQLEDALLAQGGTNSRSIHMNSDKEFAKQERQTCIAWLIACLGPQNWRSLVPSMGRWVEQFWPWYRSVNERCYINNFPLVRAMDHNQD